MARKLKGFERTLDVRELAAVAYGEIGSSIYFALGIVVSVAFGLAPVVLLVSGLIFLLVALSYVEGTTAIPETGGAATLAGRAFNDLAGFATGWVLFLDYLIVIALASLFAPHYLGAALGVDALAREPWNVVAAVFIILAVALVRLIRPTRIHESAVFALAALDVIVQLCVIGLGLALVFSPDVLADGLDLTPGQAWTDLLMAIPLAMLAYTGLETVANLAEEAREPGRTLPRAVLPAVSLVVLLTVLIAVVGVTALPPSEDGGLGDRWLEAPMVGIVTTFEGELPAAMVDVLRVLVGLSGALLLFAAATTAVSGCARLAHSMGERGMLPRELGRLERRAVVSSEAILATALTAIVIVIVGSVLADDEAVFLASAYSFGILLAFTAAQLAVLRLRRSEPDLERPFRVKPDITIRGVGYPVAALVGAPLTFVVWLIAMATHAGARYAGPAWLAVGLVIFVVVRVLGRRGLLERVEPRSELPDGARFARLLVPMKLGDIGEEMVATAVALAKEPDARVEAIFVAAVPRSAPLDAPLPPHVAAAAAASLEEAAALGEENGVDVHTDTVVARSIGHAIVDEATKRGSELIVMGSSPRWRRQSRFFSPTVDFVLRNAPCEVLVVAFPEGTLEE